MSTMITGRREFLQGSALGFGALAAGCAWRKNGSSEGAKRPNLVYVFADQWRVQSTGFGGNPEVRTPNLDRMEKESVNFVHAVSNCPVCGPHRASLMTGQYPLTHGMFVNDLRLNDNAVSFAQAYKDAGYETAYIGKWHLDGSGRDQYIPPERRQGFDYWKALECSHDYYHSAYYAGESRELKIWPGYDANAQTGDAISYLNRRASDDRPFALFLSWGGPHAPYRDVPLELLNEYDEAGVTLPPTIPDEHRDTAVKSLAGYYAHCTALDECMGRILEALAQNGLAENTMVVFTADHGDMLYNKGTQKKQHPYDESIRVPLLLRCPASWGVPSRRVEMPVGTPDLMPTILGLSGVEIPSTVEGEDFSGLIQGREPDRDRAVLIACYAPFGQWRRDFGGREYRGVRTRRYTYARGLDGDWLLYDNQADPWQQNNLVDEPAYAELRKELAGKLQALLKQTGDDFASADELIARCGYEVDEYYRVEYKDPIFWGQLTVDGRT